jgi:hypothetical protein
MMTITSKDQVCGQLLDRIERVRMRAEAETKRISDLIETVQAAGEDYADYLQTYLAQVDAGGYRRVNGSCAWHGPPLTPDEFTALDAEFQALDDAGEETWNSATIARVSELKERLLLMWV